MVRFPLYCDACEVSPATWRLLMTRIDPFGRQRDAIFRYLCVPCAEKVDESAGGN